MYISTATTGIREIDSSDPLFTINGPIVVSRRSGIKISASCPSSIVDTIAAAVNNGWIKPVAYVTDEEYMVMKLSN